MPKFDDAKPDGEEPEESAPSEGDRNRIQKELRKAGTSAGNRWARSEVGSISYTPPDKIRSKPEFIRAGELLIDDRYNRDVKPRWVEEIEGAFNPDQLQFLNVSRRLYRMVQRKSGLQEEQVFDGNLQAANRVELVVISGQHRLAATLRAKGPDFELLCNVYDGLTEDQEAELFALFDEKVRPHQPYQRHRAHVFGKNPEALAIDKVVRETGLQVYTGEQSGSRDGVIYAVSTLYSIRRNSGESMLRRVLEIHFLAWQENQEGYTSPMLQGTTLMLRRFGSYSMWRDEWLAQALADPAHNPLSIRQRAQGAASGISATSIAQEIARLEHRYYNMGKKGYARLPEWNATPREILAQSDAASARTRTPRKPENGGADAGRIA
jgi:hypothetical protein